VNDAGSAAAQPRHQHLPNLRQRCLNAASGADWNLNLNCGAGTTLATATATTATNPQIHPTGRHHRGAQGTAAPARAPAG
jgi:hypothetical protein